MKSNFLALALGLCMLPAQAQNKLTAPDGDAFDQFGAAVYFSDNHGVIGAPVTRNNGNGESAIGSVYFYAWDGAQWQKKAEVFPADGDAAQLFGVSAILDEDYAYVGAMLGNGKTVFSGTVHVLKYDGMAWKEKDILYASDGITEDAFGMAVAHWEEYLFVGAPQAPNNGFGNAGAAYVFKYNDGEWTEITKLAESDGELSGRFGDALAAYDGNVLIGAPVSQSVPGAYGAAYLYTYVHGEWVVDKTFAPDFDTYTGFGESVALGEDVVIVGALGDDTKGEDAGTVYIYTYQNGYWTLDEKLFADDAEAGDQFGEEVYLDGKRLLVGAPNGNKDGVSGNPGAAYLYEYNGDEWVFIRKLTALDAEDDDRFGLVAHLDEERAYVAAPFEDEKAEGAGAVYTYNLASPTITSFTLIDAEADYPIAAYDPIPADGVIDLSEVPTRRMSIRANTSGPVESVSLSLGPVSRVENVPPYAVFGDTDGDYVFKKFRAGRLRLIGTPYTEDDAQGEAGETKTMVLQLVDGENPRRRGEALGSYPNPFNPTTTLSFNVEVAGPARLTVYDILGREVAVLVQGTIEAGVHEVSFDASRLVSGYYFARLELAGDVQVHKMLLSK